MSERAHSHSGSLYQAFGALLLLLVLTVVAARFELGPWSAAVAVGIAGCKAVVIALYFMQVRHSPPLIRVVIGAGLLTLAIMFVLGLSDYWTRAWQPVPIPSVSEKVPDSPTTPSQPLFKANAGDGDTE